jgi:aquaporin rerated protein, other eukaryote
VAGLVKYALLPLYLLPTSYLGCIFVLSPLICRRLPYSMALQPIDPPSGLTTGQNSEDVMRPSHDSSTGLLKNAPRPLEPRTGQTNLPEPYAARLDYDPHDEVPPPRHPSRQMMRWGPPHDYWDERDDRRTYGRPSYDYGGRGMTVPDDYYAEDRWTSGRPYRRNTSVREPPPSARGPPRPPNRPRNPPRWEDPSEDESEEERPPRKSKRRSRRDSSPSPPPEVIMRLPFTEWMNGSVKNRKSSTHSTTNMAN